MRSLAIGNLFLFKMSKDMTQIKLNSLLASKHTNKVSIPILSELTGI